VLTLTITSIEVVAISAVVRHGGPNPTLMLDTLLALIMVIMNGMVGVTLLIGGVKHREQTFNLQGAASSFLSRPSPSSYRTTRRRPQAQPIRSPSNSSW
jgi:Ca2+/H+ antiporter